MILSLGAATLVGCGGSEPADSSVDPPHVISEKAMENFHTKLKNASYTIYGDSSSGSTTAVHDENMITWFFKEGSPYDNHVCLSVDGESFYAFVDYDLQELAQMLSPLPLTAFIS